LGIDIPGMASKGTMERADALPSAMMTSPAALSPRLAEEEEDGLCGSEDTASEVMNESVISSVVDRYKYAMPNTYKGALQQVRLHERRR